MFRGIIIALVICNMPGIVAANYYWITTMLQQASSDVTITDFKVEIKSKIPFWIKMPNVTSQISLFMLCMLLTNTY